MMWARSFRDCLCLLLSQYDYQILIFSVKVEVAALGETAGLTVSSRIHLVGSLLKGIMGHLGWEDPKKLVR